MDISEDEADALFGDDRERDMDALGEHHMSISVQSHGVQIEAGGRTFDLSERQKEQVLDELSADSIWWLLSDRTKSLEVLERVVNDEQE